VNMSSDQLECCIELYTAHQTTATVDSTSTAAEATSIVTDTPATVAKNAAETAPVTMPLAPPPPRMPVPAPPISPGTGVSVLVPEWPITGQAPGWTPLGRTPAAVAPGPPGLELPADARYMVTPGDNQAQLAAPQHLLPPQPLEAAQVAAPQHVLPPQPLEAAPAPPVPFPEGECVDNVTPATSDLMPPTHAAASVAPMPITPATPEPLSVADGPWGVTKAGARRRAPVPPRPEAASPSQAGISLDAWLRKRLFQLRVTIALGPKELLSVLQKLDDEQLAPPFAEAKLWLGFDDQEPMPAALEQLMTEYRAVRFSGTAVHTSAAIAPVNSGDGGGRKHS